MNQPLISIIVITYNSSKTIVETLNSIYEQTYGNIELIISDDYSKDNTIEICKEWIIKNKSRFTQVHIITSNQNTGISNNCNRGCKLAKGEWIKIIAGDDALFSNAISELIKFSHEYPNAYIVHSRMKCYKDYFIENNIEADLLQNYPPVLTNNQGDNSQKQYLLLSLGNYIGAVTVFMKRSLYKEVNGYDESIKQCEDWPMWLKITHLGYPFYFLDQYTSKYRISSSSVFGSATVNYLFSKFFEMENIIYNKYIKPFAPFIYKFTIRYYYYLRLCLDKMNLNKKNRITEFIYKLCNIPYLILLKYLSKQLNK